jgi:catechol 2,3-dioxygenase-like lactoylglutathione lyase family enzyme
MFQLEGIDHIAITVRDVERSVAWYCELLGLQRRHQDAWGSYPAMVGVGNTLVALFPAGGTPESQPPGTDATGLRHFAFRADRKNFAAAQDELRRRGISFHFEDHRISHSIYFSDPDGHQLEITTYEVQTR